MDIPAEEEDRIPVSGINHHAYCPRSYALIHLEGQYRENVFTLEGAFGHEAIDEPGVQQSGNTRVERNLCVFHEALGLFGFADVVEFRGGTPYPVDYKRGPRKRKECDDQQLCAIALCLEDMLKVHVPRGAIYHITSRRRREVVFEPKLRESTLETIAAIRQLLSSGITPSPANDRRCLGCSLEPLCLPSLKERRSGTEDRADADEVLDG